MGLLFTHTETDKYHIYRMKSGKVTGLWFLSFVVLIFAGFYIMFDSITFGAPVFFLGLVVIGIGMADLMPLRFRRMKARIRGKKEIEKGFIFRSDYEIQIEK